MATCNKSESFLYYQKYNLDIKPIKGEEFTFKYIELNKIEKSCEISKGDTVIFKTKIKVDTIGLYYYCNNKYYLTHTFSEFKKPEKYCQRVYPFIHKENILVSFKIYEIGKHSYKIICYSEMSGEDNSNITYYLDGLGFICYYELFSGNMYLCEGSKNSPIKSKVIIEAVNDLITDTAFFVKFRRPKIPAIYYKFLPPDSSYLKKNLE